MHLQTSINQSIYLRSHFLSHFLSQFLSKFFVPHFYPNFLCCFCLKRPSLICLFHTLSLSFSSFSLFLFLSLFLSLISLSLSILSLSSLSLSLFLSPKVPLLLHLIKIYGHLRPCFFWSLKINWNLWKNLADWFIFKKK